MSVSDFCFFVALMLMNDGRGTVVVLKERKVEKCEAFSEECNVLRCKRALHVSPRHAVPWIKTSSSTGKRTGQVQTY